MTDDVLTSTLYPQHFLELRDLAVRGPLERGRRYIRVHSHLGSAHEVLTLTGVVYRSPDQMRGFSGQTEKDPVFHVRMRSTYRPGYWDDWGYASDFGLWDVPGITYRNGDNYVLDPLDLLRRNIRVTGDYR